MGMVFGKTGVAEPPFQVLATRAGSIPYEIRHYGTRFVAETQEGGGESSAFQQLARYIGVFGEPENHGEEKISMTAPVASKSATKGTKIAMTAPVSMKLPDNPETQQTTTMQFFLPSTYTSLEEIPVPTNPSVRIKSLPEATGAVYRYSGSMDRQNAKSLAMQLGAQLRQQDGLHAVTDEYVQDHYEFWGYNPPFTIPMFRRNEIWIPLESSWISHLEGIERRN